MDQGLLNKGSPAPQFLAMMASDYDSGLILCCGEALYDNCLAISQAMPMTTRLVLNVETDQGLSASQGLTAKDIRIAVHKQNHLSFLDDISRYFFNLILLENNPNLTAMISGLLDKLMPGGLLVVVGAQIDQVKSGLPATGWQTVNMMWPDQTILIRAASENAQPTQRKGGRRARIKSN